MLWRIQFNVLFTAPTKLFLSFNSGVRQRILQVHVTMHKVPHLLITQMVFIVCAIFLLIFILFRDESKTKGKGRTLSDVVLARLKIVIGFYQVYFNFLSFSLKLFKLNWKVSSPENLGDRIVRDCSFYLFPF